MKHNFLYENKEFLQSVFDFYTSSITNAEYFQEIITHLKQQNSQNIFFDTGIFTKDEFKSFMISHRKKSVVTNLLDAALESLLEISVLIKIDPETTRIQKTLYSVNPGMAVYYKKNGLLLNSIFGFEYIANKYISSVFKIEVKDDINTGIGTGFLSQFNDKQLIITNHHIVNNKTVIVWSHDEKEIRIKEVISIEEKDIAFLLPEYLIDEATPFILNSQLNILDEILTIGYPPVPLAKMAYPLFHLGEINSFIEDYSSHHLFLFSAKTNPGNSGSPIINKNGTVVGMISQLLEEDSWYETSKFPYYAGIPSSEIILSMPPKVIQPNII